jgi:diaminopimelate epimerase
MPHGPGYLHRMKIEFTKMHGLGNDFVIINAMNREVNLTPDQIRRIADRHTGIGFDQLMLLQPSREPSADVKYRVYNADGSEGGQSGNGARCIGRYIRDNSIVTKDVIDAQTTRGLIHIHFDGNEDIRVDMGMPKFEPGDIPLLSDRRQALYSARLDGESITFSALSMGNPHAVIMVNDLATAPVARIGEQLQHHALFPESVNVGFLQVLDRGKARLRVYERGAGETLACGTGACAAAVAGIMAGKLDHNVVVGLHRGNLVINWNGEGTPVWMTGPAATVYTGQITL